MESYEMGDIKPMTYTLAKGEKVSGNFWKLLGEGVPLFNHDLLNIFKVIIISHLLKSHG